MQINFQRKLIIKLLPFIILFIGGIISIYAGKNFVPNNYPIFHVNEFILAVPSDFDLKNIKASPIKNNEFYSLFFSYPKEKKATAD
jgi:hypothetical protein